MDAIFTAKHPYTTWSVALEFDPTTEQELFDKVSADLEFIGFLRDPVMASVPATPGYPRQETFYKDGTALFSNWTPTERERNMTNAWAVLNKYNLPVYEQRLALVDLL